MNSLQGQLILDGGQLAGSPFSHTVVLVCVHDDNGAFGLVLNRPSTQRFGEVATDAIPDHLEHELLHWGGPVQPGAFSCLLQSPDIAPQEPGYVMPGVRLVHTPDEVPEPDTSLSSAASFRCFAGYAGWAAEQLDSEMKQDAWLTHAASNELVFGRSPADLWKFVLLAKGPQYRLLAETPDDVSLN